MQLWHSRAMSDTCGASGYKWHKHKAWITVVIDSATYLLTISSPDIDNVAMSLYDIMDYKMEWQFYRGAKRLKAS